MGTHKWPCPKCGQEQKKEAPNGEEVPVTLCAACAEKEEFEEFREALEGNDGKKGKKEKHAREEA